MEQEGISTHHGTQNSQKFLSKQPQDFFIRQKQLEMPSNPLALQLLGSDSFLCVGSEDGVTRVLSASKWNIQYKLVHEDKTPVMGLASSGEDVHSIKNSVMSVHNGGTMQFWHATSEQLLFSKTYEYSLQTCQISPNGQWYVISGQNGKMLLGHLNKGQPKNLDTGHLGSHGNRVFCIKWDPNDPNVFYSGGWDKTVFFWDVRTRTSFNKLYGIYMGGQAIDIKNKKLLLGNNQNQNQLKIYDIKADSMKLIKWEHYSDSEMHSTVGVNSCLFGSTQEDIVALSTRNEIRLIRQQSCLSMFSHSNQARGYCLAKKNNQQQIIAGWNNGQIKVLKY